MSADEDRSWPSYFRQLQNYLRWQTDQITALQRTVASLQKELAEVKEQKGVRIDKIEYSFDQLKVERLEGTLNIGVAPGGLQTVEELAVNGAQGSIGTKQGPAAGSSPQAQTGSPPFQPPNGGSNDARMAAADESDWLQSINDQIHGFLSEDMSKELQRLAEQTRLPLDDASQRLVIEDIRAQIEDRIRYYAKQEGNAAASGGRFDLAARNIIEKTKQDIRTAIEQYIMGLTPRDGGSP